MPKRMLSDGVLTSPRINALTHEAELFFYRLLVVCDDHGRMDARPDVLRAACFPLRVDSIKSSHIERWLVEMVDVGLVSRYQAKGQPYVLFSKWSDHQRLRESKGKYPAPEHEGPQPVAASCGELPQNAARSEEKRREEKGSTASAVVANDATPTAAIPALVSAPAEWPPELDPIRKHLEALQAPGEFSDPAYWRQIDTWLGKHTSIAYLDELAKYLNYERGKNKRRQHRNLRAGFSNWLRTAERIADNADQKRQQWQRR